MEGANKADEKRLPHAKNGRPKLIFDGTTFIKTHLI
jgi:hypothetical protein